MRKQLPTAIEHHRSGTYFKHQEAHCRIGSFSLRVAPKTGFLFKRLPMNSYQIICMHIPSSPNHVHSNVHHRVPSVGLSLESVVGFLQGTSSGHLLSCSPAAGIAGFTQALGEERSTISFASGRPLLKTTVAPAENAWQRITNNFASPVAQRPSEQMATECAMRCATPKQRSSL